MKPTTSPRTSPYEDAIDDAERLAARLQGGEARGGRLFARALVVLARNLRLALFAEAPDDALVRLHLKLETTMRLADADLADATREERPRADVEPPSQRPTIPYPPYLEPDASIEVDSQPRGLIRAAASQIRRKVSWDPAARSRAPEDDLDGDWLSDAAPRLARSKV